MESKQFMTWISGVDYNGFIEEYKLSKINHTFDFITKDDYFYKGFWLGLYEYLSSSIVYNYFKESRYYDLFHVEYNHLIENIDLNTKSSILNHAGLEVILDPFNLVIHNYNRNDLKYYYKIINLKFKEILNGKEILYIDGEQCKDSLHNFIMTYDKDDDNSYEESVLRGQTIDYVYDKLIQWAIYENLNSMLIRLLKSPNKNLKNIITDIEMFYLRNLSVSYTNVSFLRKASDSVYNFNDKQYPKVQHQILSTIFNSIKSLKGTEELMTELTIYLKSVPMNDLKLVPKEIKTTISKGLYKLYTKYETQLRNLYNYSIIDDVKERLLNPNNINNPQNQYMLNIIKDKETRDDEKMED